MNYTTTLRVSSLSGYPDCPRRGATRLIWAEIAEAGFRLRYLPRSIAAIVGTAVHRGAAVSLDEKARTGKLPSRDFAVAASRDGLDNALDFAEVTFDGPNGPTHNMRDAVDQTIAMTIAYHAVVAPAIEPIIVEERLEAEIAPGLILSGQPDLVAREPGAVRDLKTGVRMPASFAPQLGGYSLLARTHGLPIERASIDFVQRVRRDKPQPKPTSNTAVIVQAEVAATAIIDHIARDLEVFRKGDERRGIKRREPWAFLANPSSTLCSPKYCPAFGTEFCHEGKRHHSPREV
jgi:hypothetical protein